MCSTSMPSSATGKMNDREIAEFLEKRCILLDGFSTKEGKTFPTVLELADNGAVNMQSVIGRCPHCGGEVRVGTRAFNCSNYSNQEAPCSFAIWRNIGGHQLTLEEAKELCEKTLLHPNWRCTGRTVPFTASVSVRLRINFKS